VIRAGARRQSRRAAERQHQVTDVLTPADQAFQGVLAAARLNAEWAWEAIYDSFAPRVFSWLRMEQPGLAEDLLGETFLCVVRDLHTFEGGERAFTAWVFRIARNRLLDAVRAQARRPQSVAADPDVMEVTGGVSPDAAHDAISRMEHERIVELLRILPEDQRTTIYLRFVLDASLSDVAGALGVSVPATKMLQQRALRTLAARIPAIAAG
jgi:RNA polymerase sigma-70 factor (ECF subfamily)